MAVNLSPLAGAGWQFFDDSGNPLSGGLIYTYLAGTTTLAPTYTSSSGVTANPNPIVLNSAGRPPSEVWLNTGTEYKFIIQNSNNVLIGTYDNIIGGNDLNFASYTPAYPGAVTRTFLSKMAEDVSLKDFGAIGNGVANDTAAVTAWLASGIDQVHVSGLTRITSNVTIPNTKVVVFDAGSGFVVPSGVTLTIDAAMNAGDQQIFYCSGTGKVVCTDNSQGTAAYPVRNTKIKAIWFGVIPDAVFPTANSQTPGSAAAYGAGTVAIGTTPTGTDSTAALKMAMQYVQLSCPKVAAFTYALSAPVLSLPSGMVYVRGNNVMGNQYLTNVSDGLYAIADAGGNALVATIDGVASSVYRNANYEVNIEGNGCTILWKVDASTDVFWDCGFTVNKITARDFSVCPIIATNNWGVFFRNKALTTAGSSNNSYNALGPALFENVNVRQNILGGDNSANFNGYLSYPALPNQALLKYCFWMEGYSRGDNITVRNGYYNAFNIFWQGDNPEAVDLRFHDNIIQLAVDGSRVWVFTAFFGGFVASGNFFDIKHNDCKLVEEQFATTYIGTSTVNSFDCTYNFLPGQRYEFKTGLTGWTTFVGVGGRFNMFDMNIGTGGTPSTATDATVAYKSTANFDNCKVAGKATIKYTAWSNTSASGQSTGTPKINYNNCEPFLQPWMTALYWENSVGGLQDYNAAVQNFTQAFAGYGIQNISYFKNALTLPSYYATDTGTLNPVTATWVDRKNSTNYVYGTGDFIALWPYTKITSIKLFAQSHGGTFDNVRLTFGNTAAGATSTYVLNYASAGAQVNGAELLSSGTALIVPTSIGAFNQVKCELTLAGAVQAVTNIGYFQFTYQVVTGISELSGLTGVVTNQSLI
jgi:hypothetical protein